MDLAMFGYVLFLTLIYFLFASYSNEKSEARILEAPEEANTSSPSIDPPQVHEASGF